VRAYEHFSLAANMREEGRSVQRVINALDRRDAVEASGLVDGLIAVAARRSEPRKTVVPKSKNVLQDTDN
jgi:hypothetical protein